LCLRLLAFAIVLSVAIPDSAEAAPNALSKAARCYAAGDMVCVIERLESAALPNDATKAAEHHRMLAVAAAKMDRHAMAREAFSRWIALNPNRHRLARSTTAPAVYADWSAAWLKVHAGKLDLQPKKMPKPAPLPEPVTAGDLPRFPPPKRSSRDKAGDVTVELGAFAIPTGGAVGGTIAAVMNARSVLRVDLVGVVGTRIGKPMSFGAVFARPSVRFLDHGSWWLRGALAAGAMTWGDDDAEMFFAVEPGIRAVWRASKSLAPFLHLGYAIVARSSSPGIGPTVNLGVTFLTRDDKRAE